VRCATCGAELIEVGYPVDFYQEYRCPNGCEKIFRKRDLLVSYASAAAALLFMVLVLYPVALSLWAVSKFAEVIGWGD